MAGAGRPAYSLIILFLFRGAGDGKSDKTFMAEAVSREEERIMLKIQQRLEQLGWKTGTLIHESLMRSSFRSKGKSQSQRSKQS